jgi:hypothetical protein
MEVVTPPTTAMAKDALLSKILSLLGTTGFHAAEVKLLSEAYAQLASGEAVFNATF